MLFALGIETLTVDGFCTAQSLGKSIHILLNFLKSIFSFTGAQGGKEN